MKNGMAIVERGKVSVLVFSSPDMRRSIGQLLVTTENPLMTRLAVMDDVLDDDALRAALLASVELYPLPPGASGLCEGKSSGGTITVLERTARVAGESLLVRESAPDPKCASCGESLQDCYVIRCDHGFPLHEDTCNPEHEGLEDPCPIARLALVTEERDVMRMERDTERAANRILEAQAQETAERVRGLQETVGQIKAQLLELVGKKKP